MGAVPDIAISADGTDRSSVVKARLLTWNLTTTTGKKADELLLTFDDRGSGIVLPTHGVQLGISIGYVGDPLIAHGLFTVDETEIKGPPDTVIVRARSADMRSTLKAHKNRSWRGMTIGAVIAQIAADNSLSAQVNPDLAGVQIAHRDQTGESDLHFVTRLAHDNDAIASVKGGQLIMVPKGLAVSASGKALTDLALTRSDLSAWGMIDSDRNKVGTVRARYRDMDGAQDDFAVDGGEDPVATMRHIQPNAALATRTAHARHMRMKREGHKVSVSLAEGDPNVFAGVAIVLSGLRDGVDGRWISDQVVHEGDWANKGYATGIEATVDGKDPDTGDGTPTYGGDDADSGEDDGGDE